MADIEQDILQQQVDINNIEGAMASTINDMHQEKRAQDALLQEAKDAGDAIMAEQTGNTYTPEQLAEYNQRVHSQGNSELSRLASEYTKMATQRELEWTYKELDIESRRQDAAIEANTNYQLNKAYRDNQWDNHKEDTLHAFNNNNLIDNAIHFKSDELNNRLRELDNRKYINKLLNNQQLDRKIQDIYSQEEYQRELKSINMNAIHEKINLDLQKVEKQLKVGMSASMNMDTVAEAFNAIHFDTPRYGDWMAAFNVGGARTLDSVVNIFGADSPFTNMLGYEYSSHRTDFGDWKDRLSLEEVATQAVMSVPDIIATILTFSLGGSAVKLGGKLAAGGISRALGMATSLEKMGGTLSKVASSKTIAGASALNVAAAHIRKIATNPTLLSMFSASIGGGTLEAIRRGHQIAVDRANKEGSQVDFTFRDFIAGLQSAALDVAGFGVAYGAGKAINAAKKAASPSSGLGKGLMNVGGGVATLGAGYAIEGTTELLQSYIEEAGANGYDFHNLMDILNSDNPAFDQVRKELIDSFNIGGLIGSGFAVVGGASNLAKRAMSRPTSAGTSSASISKYDKLGMALDSYMDQLDSYNELLNDDKATDADKEAAKADLDEMKKDLQQRVGDELDLSTLEGEEGRKKIADYIESKKADTVDEVIAKIELDEDTNVKEETPKAETLEEVGKKLDEQAKEAELENVLSDNVAETAKPKGTPKKTKFEKTVDGTKAAGKAVGNVGKEVVKGAVNIAGDISNAVIAGITGDPVDAQGRDTKENKTIKKELLKAYGNTKASARKGNEGAKEVVNRFVNIARNPEAMKSLLKTMRDDEATRAQFMEAVNKGDYATLDKVMADKFADVAKAMDNTKLSDLYLLAAKATKEKLTPKDAETVLKSFNDNEIISTVHTALEQLDKSENSFSKKFKGIFTQKIIQRMLNNTMSGNITIADPTKRTELFRIIDSLDLNDEGKTALKQFYTLIDTGDINLKDIANGNIDLAPRPYESIFMLVSYIREDMLNITKDPVKGSKIALEYMEALSPLLSNLTLPSLSETQLKAFNDIKAAIANYDSQTTKGSLKAIKESIANNMNELPQEHQAMVKALDMLYTLRDALDSERNKINMAKRLAKGLKSDDAKGIGRLINFVVRFLRRILNREDLEIDVHKLAPTLGAMSSYYEDTLSKIDGLIDTISTNNDLDFMASLEPDSRNYLANTAVAFSRVTNYSDETLANALVKMLDYYPFKNETLFLQTLNLFNLSDTSYYQIREYALNPERLDSSDKSKSTIKADATILKLISREGLIDSLDDNTKQLIKSTAEVLLQEYSANNKTIGTNGLVSTNELDTHVMGRLQRIFRTYSETAQDYLPMFNDDQLKGAIAVAHMLLTNLKISGKNVVNITSLNNMDKASVNRNMGKVLEILNDKKAMAEYKNAQETTVKEYGKSVKYPANSVNPSKLNKFLTDLLFDESVAGFIAKTSLMHTKVLANKINQGEMINAIDIYNWATEATWNRPDRQTFVGLDSSIVNLGGLYVEALRKGVLDEDNANKGKPIILNTRPLEGDGYYGQALTVNLDAVYTVLREAKSMIGDKLLIDDSMLISEKEHNDDRYVFKNSRIDINGESSKELTYLTYVENGELKSNPFFDIPVPIKQEGNKYNIAYYRLPPELLERADLRPFDIDLNGRTNLNTLSDKEAYLAKVQTKLKGLGFAIMFSNTTDENLENLYVDYEVMSNGRYRETLGTNMPFDSNKVLRALVKRKDMPRLDYGFSSAKEFDDLDPKQQLNLMMITYSALGYSIDKPIPVDKIDVEYRRYIRKGAMATYGVEYEGKIVPIEFIIKRARSGSKLHKSAKEFILDKTKEVMGEDFTEPNFLNASMLYEALSKNKPFDINSALIELDGASTGVYQTSLHSNISTNRLYDMLTNGPKGLEANYYKVFGTMTDEDVKKFIASDPYLTVASNFRERMIEAAKTSTNPLLRSFAQYLKDVPLKTLRDIGKSIVNPLVYGGSITNVLGADLGSEAAKPFREHLSSEMFKAFEEYKRTGRVAFKDYSPMVYDFFDSHKNLSKETTNEDFNSLMIKHFNSHLRETNYSLQVLDPSVYARNRALSFTEYKDYVSAFRYLSKHDIRKVDDLKARVVQEGKGTLDKDTGYITFNKDTKPEYKSNYFNMLTLLEDLKNSGKEHSILESSLGDFKHLIDHNLNYNDVFKSVSFSILRKAFETAATILYHDKDAVFSSETVLDKAITIFNDMLSQGLDFPLDNGETIHIALNGEKSKITKEQLRYVFAPILKEYDMEYNTTNMIAMMFPSSIGNKQLHRSYSAAIDVLINSVAPIMNHPIESLGVQGILNLMSDAFTKHPVVVQMYDALYTHGEGAMDVVNLWNKEAMMNIYRSGTFTPLTLVAETYSQLKDRLNTIREENGLLPSNPELKIREKVMKLAKSSFNFMPQAMNNIMIADLDTTIYKLTPEELRRKLKSMFKAIKVLTGVEQSYFGMYEYYTEETKNNVVPLNHNGVLVHKFLNNSGKNIVENIEKEITSGHKITITKDGNGGYTVTGTLPEKDWDPYYIDATDLTYAEAIEAVRQMNVGPFKSASVLKDRIRIYKDERKNFIRLHIDRAVPNKSGGYETIQESVIYRKNNDGIWNSVKVRHAIKKENGEFEPFSEGQLQRDNYIPAEIYNNIPELNRTFSTNDMSIFTEILDSHDEFNTDENQPLVDYHEIKPKDSTQKNTVTVNTTKGTPTKKEVENLNISGEGARNYMEMMHGFPTYGAYNEEGQLTVDYRAEVTEADYTDVVLQDILDSSSKVTKEVFFNDINSYLDEMGNKAQTDTVRSLIALAPKNLDIRVSNLPEGINGLFTMVENVPTIVVSNNASGRTKLHEFLHAMTQHVLVTGHPSINAAKGTVTRIKGYIKHLIDTKEGYGESIGIVKNGRVYREIFNEGNIGEFISYFLSDPEKLNALHYLTKDEVKAWEKANNMKDENWLGRGKRLILAFIKAVVTLFNSSLMSNTVNRDLGSVLIDSAWDIGKYSNQEYVDGMISTKLRRALDAMNKTFKHLIYRGSLGLLESEAHFIKRYNIDEDEYLAMRNDAYKQVLRNYKKYGAFTPAAVALTLDLKTLFNPVYRSAMAEVWRNILNSSDKALYKEINNILLNFRVFHDKSDIGTSYRGAENVTNTNAMVQTKIEAAKASGYKFIDEAIRRTFPDLKDTIDNPNTELYKAIKAIQEKRGSLYNQANYQTNMEGFNEAMGLLASLNLGDAVFHEMSKDFMKNKVEMDLIFDFIYNRDSKYGELMPRLYAKRDFLVKNIIQQLKKLGIEREGLDNFLINGSNLLAKARITDNYSGAGLRNVEVLLEHLGDSKLTERVRQAYTKTDRRINYISDTLKALVATNTMIMLREPSSDPDIIFMSQSIALAGTVLSSADTNVSVKFLYPIINEWKNLQDELVKRIKANIAVNGDGIQLLSKETYNDLGSLYMDNWTPSVWRDNVQVVHLTNDDFGNWGETKEEARKNLQLAGFKQIDPKNGKEIEMNLPVEHYVYTGWARYEDTYEPNMQLGSTRRTRGYVVDIAKDKVDANYANAVLGKRDEIISSLFDDTDSFKSSYLDKPKTSDFEAFDSLNSTKLRMNMTRLEKMNVIKLNYSIDEMMAQAHGQLMAKGLSDEMDTHLADALFQDTLKVYEGKITDMNNYVAIFTNKWMDKEGQVPEQFKNLLGPTLRGKLADIMHKYNKGAIEVINGVTYQLRKPIDTIYVRKELVDIYFGGLDTALANKATNGITKKILGYLDAGLKGGMREYKNNVILRSPEVIISNVISNLATTAVAGVSPVDAMQSFEPLANEILEFRNLKDEFFKAYQKYQANPTRENQSAMYRIDKKMKELSVYKPLTMGLDSNIIDDISTDKNDNWIDSGAAKAATYIADTFGWSRDTATKWAAEAILSPNSEIIKFSTLVTQLSDLIPKILIYQRAKADGKSDIQAINEANDYLVNYNMPMKGVVYKAAEKYAMAPFFKWFAGQQKISSKMLVEKPITAASVLAFNTMMSPFINMSSVATENVLLKGTPFGNFMPDNLFRYNFIL